MKRTYGELMPRYKIPVRLVYRSFVTATELAADSPEHALELVKENAERPWDVMELEFDLENSEFGTPEEVETTPLTPEQRALAEHFRQSLVAALTEREGDAN